MFTALGRLVVRRPKLTLLVSLVVVVLAAILGTGAFTALKNGGFEDPSSDSARAQVILEEELGAGSPNLMLVVTAKGGDVDAPEAAAAGKALSDQLTATAGVEEVTSYWLLGSPPPLRSESGNSALVMARAGGTDLEIEETVTRVQDSLEGDRGAVSVQVGGSAAIDAALGHTLEDDLVRAELIAIPLTLLLLLFVFRGVVAALLPLVVAIAAIMGALFVLWAFAQFTDVSVFSINLVTALGIGLAIDYSLLIVSRFREELKAGYDPKVATIRTVESAGRTVVFSGVTVAVALLSLIAFPMFFLRSFAYAGVGVVLVAILASVIILPAILALLGHRVNAWRLPGTRREAEGGSRRWAAIASGVLRRPGLVTGAAVAILLLLSAPVLGIKFGNPDARVLPADVAARQATEAAQRDFGYDALPIVIQGTSNQGDIEAYAAAASRVTNVTEVDTQYGTWANGQRTAGPTEESGRYAADAGQWLEVFPAVQPISGEAEDVVRDLRAIDAPFDALVSGSTAALVDTKAGITSVAPWAAVWIAVATFALLFLMFGSFLVPLKAIVLNTLNLTAMLGAMVWIYQDGNLSGLLNFTSTGLMDVSMPLLMFAVAFGLSMDYEVFLLARMKEEYDRTGDNKHAIIAGIANTGPIVTAAALVLSITFFAFGTAGVTFMQMFGLGLGLAVLIDAFLVRATLVPALMKMAGKANWWAPSWARKLHQKAGIDETGGTLSTSVERKEREPELVG